VKERHLLWKYSHFR